MADLDQLNAALVKADAAGDAAGAKMLADHIREVQAAGGTVPAKQAPGLAAQAWDGTKNLGLGLLKGVLAPIDGAAQLVTNGASKLTHMIAPGSAADKATADYAQNVNDINTDRENKYQALTPGSVTAGIGNVVGNVIVPLPGMSAVRGASVAARLGKAALTGGAVGAIQPVYGAGEKSLSDQVTGGQPASYWDEKGKQVALGAALGGGLSGLGSAAGAAYKAVRPAIAPGATVGDMLAGKLSGLRQRAQDEGGNPADVSSLAGATPQVVLDRINAAKQLVPGSQPTTAQVAGIPDLVMAEKVLKNNPASRVGFENRAIGNNQARLAELLRVAKTPQDLQDAMDARSAAASPLYDASQVEQHTVDDALKGIMTRPSGAAALNRGRKIADEQGKPFGVTDAVEAAPAAPSGILDANGQPFVGGGAPAQPGQMSGKALQYMKMGIDALQSEGRTNGISSHEANALSGTQNDLTRWIEQQSPTYAQANKTYASLSQPVNTMEAAQSLQGALANGTQNAAGDVSPMLSQYRNQLAKALKGAKYGIEPEAQKSLEAIQSDLQRETISNSIKSSGSDTAFNLQAPNWLSGQLYGKQMDGNSTIGRGLGMLGGMIGGGPIGAYGGKAAAEKIGSFVGNRIDKQFQDAMLNPEVFAKLLADAIKRGEAPPSVLQKLAPTGTRAAALGGIDTATGP